jgi:hypothetical protein
MASKKADANKKRREAKGKSTSPKQVWNPETKTWDKANG